MAGRLGLRNIPTFMLENIEGKAYLEELAGKYKDKMESSI